MDSRSAIATLALGMGSAVLYSVVLRPLPHREPTKLWIDDAKRDVHEEGVSYPTFLDGKRQSKTFADIAVRGRGGSGTLSGAEPERILIDIVSANFLKALGVSPGAGSDRRRRRSAKRSRSRAASGASSA